MYEPSRVLLSFHIAGFQYADGALVLGDLKAGDKLTLCAERDNPHDPEAVAIYYGNTKLGYVPGNEVGPLSLMMYYGHEDVFEARVQQVAPERSPWHSMTMGWSRAVGNGRTRKLRVTLRKSKTSAATDCSAGSLANRRARASVY